jgi:lactoylglutathione lyase
MPFGATIRRHSIGSPQATPPHHAARRPIAALGGAFSREPGPLKDGNTIIDFVTDPDGHKLELFQHPG